MLVTGQVPKQVVQAYAAPRGVSNPIRRANKSTHALTLTPLTLSTRSSTSHRATVRVAAAASDSPWKKRDARLVLQDGSVFVGCSFGLKGTMVGEVVFNTSITGYQEILTDPSYYKQFVCFTHPHIGNVGINFEDDESSKCWMKGCIVRDLSLTVSNYRSKMDLDTYLKEQGVVGISDIDTRQLTKVLRSYGCLNGVITSDASLTNEQLIKMSKEFNINGVDCIKDVTTTKMYEWNGVTDNEWEFSRVADKSRKEQPLHIVAYDYGIKTNILRRLGSFGCRVTVVPASTPASEVMALHPDGVFFSNGPGDPSAVPYAVENAKQILGKVPTFGICMGHQIMGQAFGGKTFKLPFGHHGGNHPIRDMMTGQIEISAQNHNFAVDPASLPKGVEVQKINLNDGTCAGMMWADKQALSIQYHPEAAPGPHDSDSNFEIFVNMVRKNKAALKK